MNVLAIWQFVPISTRMACQLEIATTRENIVEAVRIE